MMRLSFRLRGTLASSMLTAAAIVFGIQSTTPTLQAQSVIVGSGSASAGTPVDIEINFVAGAAPGVSAMQFDLSFSSDLTFSSLQVGTATTDAGKLLGSNQVTPPPEVCTECNGIRILIYGQNQTAIGSGNLVTIRFTTSKGGNYALHIYGIVASNPYAVQVTCPGTDGNVTFQKKRAGQITTS